ncbi:MAG: hypothetical protein DRP82_04940, partial [Planctomycetota bacterium]
MLGLTNVRTHLFAYAVIAVLIMPCATGCSGRKRKTNSPASLRITTTALPDATEGVAYSYTLQATGGTTPYTWTVSGLPSGLTWTQVGDAVEISGTPDVGTAGTYSV